MHWSHIFIIGLLLQSIFIFNVDGNAYRRRRRQRRQTSGSLYGMNAHLGASAPAGYNYPASYSIQGDRLNNPDARVLNLNPTNPLLPPSLYNTGNRLTSVDLNGDPRPQQQQTYGTNNEAVLNYYFSGNSFPSGLAPSFYPSSDLQQAYPAILNQVSSYRSLYGASSNTNNMKNYQYPNNNNNNNQLPNSNSYGNSMGNNMNQFPNSNSYGGSMDSNTYRDQTGFNNNNNQLPGSNTYGGPMGSNNNNQLPNSNSYGGSMGGNRANLIPNSNSYSGYLGTLDNTESWPNNNNNNNNNRYNPNTGNSYYPNRDTNYNTNNYNRYGNGFYNHSDRLTKSIGVFFVSLLISMILHF